MTSGAAAQTGVDRIHRRNGIDSGEITKITPLGVTISKSGVESKIPVEEIRNIYFAGQPAELETARKAAASGSYQTALDLLAKVAERNVDRKEIQQELDFLWTTCKARLAIGKGENLDEAVEQVQRFLSRSRTSYHVPEMLELLGDVHRAADDPAAARKEYEKLAKAPAPYYKARSSILVGELLQQQDKHQQAVKQLETALAAIEGDIVAASLQPRAELGRAVSQASLGELSRALESIKQLIVKADPEDTQLLAQVYNALGDCYLAGGDKRAARDAYLHVELLFESATSHHAEALYKLSQLWKELQHPSRAAAAEETLSAKYPTSPWNRR